MKIPIRVSVLIPLYAFLGGVVLSSSCSITPTHQDTQATTDSSLEDDVLIVVYSDLVRKADDDAKIVRFVELPSASIERLKAAVGNRYLIFSIDAAADETSEGIRLRNSKKQGIALRAEIIEIKDDTATAAGVYLFGPSAEAVDYEMKRTNGKWQIIATKNTRYISSIVSERR